MTRTFSKVRIVEWRREGVGKWNKERF